MNPVCPCTGGDGGAEVVWLAVVFAAVLLVARLRRRRKYNVIRRSDVKNEEHGSKSIFDGRTAAPSQDDEDSGKAHPFPWKAAVVIGLIVLVGLVFALKRRGDLPGPGTTASHSGDASTGAVSGDLPRLIEIGSVTCIPCKMMKPILDELRQEYAGRLQVDFIDVQVDRKAIMKYGIRMIPTQVFLSAEGKELFRHEGFFPKEEILSKWKEVGIDLDSLRQEEPPEPPQTESKGNT